MASAKHTCNWFVRIEFLYHCRCHLMLGEWFNTITLFFLILEYGSEFLLGMLFTVRMAGFASCSRSLDTTPTDTTERCSRVVSNLLQAGFALCFLLE